MVDNSFVEVAGRKIKLMPDPTPGRAMAWGGTLAVWGDRRHRRRHVQGAGDRDDGGSPAAREQLTPLGDRIKASHARRPSFTRTAPPEGPRVVTGGQRLLEARQANLRRESIARVKTNGATIAAGAASPSLVQHRRSCPKIHTFDDPAGGPSLRRWDPPRHPTIRARVASTRARSRGDALERGKLKSKRRRIRRAVGSVVERRRHRFQKRHRLVDRFFDRVDRVRGRLGGSASFRGSSRSGNEKPPKRKAPAAGGASAGDGDLKVIARLHERLDRVRQERELLDEEEIERKYPGDAPGRGASRRSSAPSASASTTRRRTSASGTRATRERPG